LAFDGRRGAFFGSWSRRSKSSERRYRRKPDAGQLGEAQWAARSSSPSYQLFAVD
jgi:hypothetical protein